MLTVKATEKGSRTATTSTISLLQSRGWRSTLHLSWPRLATCPGGGVRWPATALPCVVVVVVNCRFWEQRRSSAAQRRASPSRPGKRMQERADSPPPCWSSNAQAVKVVATRGGVWGGMAPFGRLQRFPKKTWLTFLDLLWDGWRLGVWCGQSPCVLSACLLAGWPSELSCPHSSSSSGRATDATRWVCACMIFESLLPCAPSVGGGGWWFTHSTDPAASATA
jgi:hypothetical protein